MSGERKEHTEEKIREKIEKLKEELKDVEDEKYFALVVTDAHIPRKKAEEYNKRIKQIKDEISWLEQRLGGSETD